MSLYFYCILNSKTERKVLNIKHFSRQILIKSSLINLKLFLAWLSTCIWLFDLLFWRHKFWHICSFLACAVMISRVSMQLLMHLLFIFIIFDLCNHSFLPPLKLGVSFFSKFGQGRGSWKNYSEIGGLVERGGSS